jgi:hypothetical protein
MLLVMAAARVPMQRILERGIRPRELLELRTSAARSNEHTTCRTVERDDPPPIVTRQLDQVQVLLGHGTGAPREIADRSPKRSPSRHASMRTHASTRVHRQQPLASESPLMVVPFASQVLLERDAQRFARADGRQHACTRDRAARRARIRRCSRDVGIHDDSVGSRHSPAIAARSWISTSISVVAKSSGQLP